VVVTIETVNQPGSPYLSVVEGLASHRRLVLCERRGHGMSDPVTHVPTMDERVADLRAGIDAAGVDKLVLVGSGEAGPLVIRFATDHPERVTALALVSTAARFTQDLPTTPGDSPKLRSIDSCGISTRIGVKARCPSYFSAR
jgi:pimeloyl-ACP methyl ester carboxylesterase